MVMRAGAMRNRVQLQQCDITPDAIGQQQKNWTTQATVWASIEPIMTKKGGEFYASHKFSIEVDSIIKIRYQENLDESWRVYHEATGHTFAIVEIVVPESIRREMDLLCKRLPMGEPVK